MKKVAKFEKVSFEKFYESCMMHHMTVEDIHKSYNSLKIPKRATKGSAGYDFYSPFDFELNPGETILIPTGIRCKINEGYFLGLFPRSGLGFKYRMQLNNTVGIIDSDYYFSDNEGHIMAKITNDTNENKKLCIKAGEGFMQGIFISFGITKDDVSDGVRDGGFGSTDKQRKKEPILYAM